jgi:hypothetical protein
MPLNFDASLLPLSWFDEDLVDVGFSVKQYTGSGGLTFAGAAERVLVQVFEPTGGLAFAGAATTAQVQVYTPAGGVIFAGAATTSVSRAFLYIGAGGLVLAGAASPTVIQVFVPTGGLALAGGAAIAAVQVYEAAGGLALSGAATKSRTRVWVPAGGLTLAGVASVAAVQVYAPSVGGLLLSGAAAVLFTGPHTFLYTMSGGVVFGGQADTISPKPALPTGPAGFMWLPPVKAPAPPPEPAIREVIGAGGLVFGGAAATVLVKVAPVIPSRLVRLVGAADCMMTVDAEAYPWLRRYLSERADEREALEVLGV